MPAYHVTRSQLIHASKQDIKAILCDYQQWPMWSPWLIIEPDTLLTYNEHQGEVGANYSWKGELVGQGSMELTDMTDNELVMQLQFITPFKSKARVTFELEEQGEDTKVTWNMFGKLPFFLFWMVDNIKAYVGMDYARGLMMLKEYIETGNVNSTVHIEGVTTQQAQQYIGIENECNIKDMAMVMPADYQKLNGFIAENNLLQEGMIPFSIYNTFDVKEGHTSYIAAIPVSKDIDVSAPFIKGKLAQSEGIKVTHTGSYKHIGNAWSAAMTYSRTKKIRIKKKPVGIEYYLNDPAETPEQDLIAEVVLQLK